MCQMVETHHVHKLDAPEWYGQCAWLEGTLENLDRKQKWVMGALTCSRTVLVTGARRDCAPDELPVSAIREGEVPGMPFTIKYESEADSIVITHDAKNRKGFAVGAVLAAEYTAAHQGFLGMNDLFQPFEDMIQASRKQWIKLGRVIVLVLYLIFLIWLKSWLGLVVVPFAVV